MKKTIRKFLPKIIGLKLNSLFYVNQEAALEQAFYLFCTPRRGRLEPDQTAFLEPAKAGKAQIKNIPVQFYRWPGTGKTVLLVHGWESNAQRWKGLIEKLQAENHDIVALDAPGHGNSGGKSFNVPLYAECLEAAIEKFKPNFVIAHSIGAMTAVFQQYKKPSKKIEKLVLLGPPSELTEIMADFQKVFGFHQNFMKALENLFDREFGYTFAGFSTARFAKKLRQKGLVVHDRFDKIAPLSASEAISKNWKDSRLAVTEGAGHSLNNEGVFREVLGFLKKKKIFG